MKTGKVTNDQKLTTSVDRSLIEKVLKKAKDVKDNTLPSFIEQFLRENKLPITFKAIIDYLDHMMKENVDKIHKQYFMKAKTVISQTFYMTSIPNPKSKRDFTEVNIICGKTGESFTIYEFINSAFIRVKYMLSDQNEIKKKLTEIEESYQKQVPPDNDERFKTYYPWNECAQALFYKNPTTNLEFPLSSILETFDSFCTEITKSNENLTKSTTPRSSLEQESKKTTPMKRAVPPVKKTSSTTTNDSDDDLLAQDKIQDSNTSETKKRKSSPTSSSTSEKNTVPTKKTTTPVYKKNKTTPPNLSIVPATSPQAPERYQIKSLLEIDGCRLASKLGDPVRIYGIEPVEMIFAKFFQALVEEIVVYSLEHNNELPDFEEMATQYLQHRETLKQSNSVQSMMNPSNHTETQHQNNDSEDQTGLVFTLELNKAADVAMQTVIQPNQIQQTPKEQPNVTLLPPPMNHVTLLPPPMNHVTT